MSVALHLALRGVLGVLTGFDKIMQLKLLLQLLLQLLLKLMPPAIASSITKWLQTTAAGLCCMLQTNPRSSVLRMPTHSAVSGHPFEMVPLVVCIVISQHNDVCKLRKALGQLPLCLAAAAGATHELSCVV